MTCGSGVFIVNFEHISHLFLVFLLLNLNKKLLTGYAVTRILMQQNVVSTILVFQGLFQYYLIHFKPNFHFYTLRKCQKNSGFLTFSWGIEIEHLLKIGRKMLRKMKLQNFKLNL